jgi:DNA-directed RNA polymerase specialized sigma24 family protein
VALRQGRFAGEEKVQAFIWKAAKMAWRMRCRKWETRMSGLSESFDLPDPAHGRWMREFVHDEVYRDQIRAMLGRACPKCARLFELQFFRGFGDDALADDLGVRNSTLKVKRSRCLKKLREYIESHPEAARLFEDSAINIHTP